MNDNTWFKVYRKILDWDWFLNSRTLHVFIFLLARANIRTSSMSGRIIKRGQVVTSYPKIAEATGMSVSSARRAIENLVSTGEIITEPTNKYNLITIVKYEMYQAQRRDLEQADEQADEQHHKKGKNTRKKGTGKKHTAPKAPADLSQIKEIEENPDAYVPQYFELNIPAQYVGKFESEDEWWAYVDNHREEVEQAYEL